MIARSRLNTHARTLADVVVDNFQRASLGSNWTVHLGDAAIVASADWGAAQSAGIHISSWAGSPTPGLNQFAQGVVASGVDALMQRQVYVRRRSADTARYALHYNFEFSPTPQWEIKYDGVATEFTRILATSTATGHAAGSVLRLEARGSGATVSLKAYHNGVLLMEADDTDADRINTLGPPGLVCRAAVGETLSYPSPVFAEFSAGTLL